MTSSFWSNDPKDNHRIFRDRKGRMVVKVVTPGGVVAIIGADIPVTTIRALKERIKGRSLLREQEAADSVRSNPPDDSGND